MGKYPVMEYRVSLTESAKEDLDQFDIRDRRIIVAGIMTHLKVDPEVPTKNARGFDQIPSHLGSYGSSVFGSSM